MYFVDLDKNNKQSKKESVGVRNAEINKMLVTLVVSQHEVAKTQVTVVCECS